MIETTTSFAGLCVKFISDSEVKVPPKFRPYISGGEPDITINVTVGDLPEEKGEKLFENDVHVLLETEDGLMYYSSINYMPQNTFEKYACFVKGKKSADLIVTKKAYISISMLLNAIDVPSLLLEKGKVMFHCSCIEYKGKAVLFTAPSGTGKSTQAELWTQNVQAEVINGDRMALGTENGVLTAFGTPFNGTSGICIKKNLPVAAIVCLKQGKTNEIEKLSGMQAYIRLYEGVSFYAEFEELEEKVFEILSSALTTPIYELSCKPDKCAVDLLKARLDSEVYS